MIMAQLWPVSGVQSYQQECGEIRKGPNRHEIEKLENCVKCPDKLGNILGKAALGTNDLNMDHKIIGVINPAPGRDMSEDWHRYRARGRWLEIS